MTAQIFLLFLPGLVHRWPLRAVPYLMSQVLHVEAPEDPYEVTDPSEQFP